MTLTASLILGDVHPRRQELIPLHAIEVYESGTVSLCIRPLVDEGSAQTWHSIHPEELVTTLLAVMALVLPDFDQHPINQLESVDFDDLDLEHLSHLASLTRSEWAFGVAATLHEGSTLHLEDLQGLTQATLRVFSQSYEQEPGASKMTVDDLAVDYLFS
jgi:hypothetical protein